jgi:hypothetical protein
VEPVKNRGRRISGRNMALAIILVTVILGIIDYATGDYSMLVFYLVPVSVAGWFLGLCFALVLSIFCGVIRFCADFNSYEVFTFSCGLNILKDTSFFMAVAIATPMVRRMLEFDGIDRR